MRWAWRRGAAVCGGGGGRAGLCAGKRRGGGLCGELEESWPSATRGGQGRAGEPAGGPQQQRGLPKGPHWARPAAPFPRSASSCRGGGLPLSRLPAEVALCGGFPRGRGPVEASRGRLSLATIPGNAAGAACKWRLSRGPLGLQRFARPRREHLPFCPPHSGRAPLLQPSLAAGHRSGLYLPRPPAAPLARRCLI